MKILFVSSECAPFSKSGGLADVAFSLPPALQKTGDDMAIVTPMYRVTQENYGDEFERIKTCQIVLGQRRLACSLYRGALNGVTVYAIGNEHLFHRPRLYGYGDDSLRFAFFCRAVIDLLPEFGDLPDILHCNDWETALAILYLKTTRCCGRNFLISRRCTPSTTSPIRGSSAEARWKRRSLCRMAGITAA